MSGKRKKRSDSSNIIRVRYKSKSVKIYDATFINFKIPTSKILLPRSKIPCCRGFDLQKKATNAWLYKHQSCNSLHHKSSLNSSSLLRSPFSCQNVSRPGSFFCCSLSSSSLHIFGSPSFFLQRAVPILLLDPSSLKKRGEIEKNDSFGGKTKKVNSFRKQKTSTVRKAGTLLSESGFESETHAFPFWNQCFDKNRLKNFVLWFLVTYGEYRTVELIEQFKNIGFEYATKAGISLGIDDLKIPPKKSFLIVEAEKQTKSALNQYNRGEITGVERFQKMIDTWHRTSEILKQEVIDNFELTDTLNPVYMMAFSGARGNISQVRQLVGMRGLMANPQGQILDFPIQSNFREGLSLTEYIISTYGARKGIVDTALRTANAGYLTRRLVDVAQHVIVSNFDCGTYKGIFLNDMKEGNKVLYSLQNRLIGRVLGKNVLSSGKIVPLSALHRLSREEKSKLPSFSHSSLGSQKTNATVFPRNIEISIDLAVKLCKISNKIFVRSTLTCDTQKSVCQLCYGWSLAQGNLVSIGEAVGVVAAQSVGEPGTQLTMRTFHTGGVFSGDITDQIKALYDGFVQYLEPIAGTLIRTPEGKIAFLTKTEGFIQVIPLLSLPEIMTNANPTFGTVFPLILSPGEKRKDKPKKNRSETSEGQKNKIYKIPSYTLLFARHGENVFAKQVIAQISNISRQQNKRDDAEFTINSDMEGEFYSEKLNLLEKQSVLSEEAELEASDWGYAWILSGKVYQLPVLSQFFPQPGDFINRKSLMNQIQLKVTSHGGNFGFLETKKNDTLILNKPVFFLEINKTIYKKIGYLLTLPESCFLNTGFLRSSLSSFLKTQGEKHNKIFFLTSNDLLFSPIAFLPIKKSNNLINRLPSHFSPFNWTQTQYKTSSANWSQNLSLFLEWFPHSKLHTSGAFINDSHTLQSTSYTASMWPTKMSFMQKETRRPLFLWPLQKTIRTEDEKRLTIPPFREEKKEFFSYMTKKLYYDQKKHISQKETLFGALPLPFSLNLKEGFEIGTIAMKNKINKIDKLKEELTNEKLFWVSRQFREIPQIHFPKFVLNLRSKGRESLRKGEKALLGLIPLFTVSSSNGKENIGEIRLSFNESPRNWAIKNLRSRIHKARSRSLTASFFSGEGVAQKNYLSKKNRQGLKQTLLPRLCKNKLIQIVLPIRIDNSLYQNKFAAVASKKETVSIPRQTTFLEKFASRKASPLLLTLEQVQRRGFTRGGTKVHKKPLLCDWNNNRKPFGVSKKKRRNEKIGRGKEKRRIWKDNKQNKIITVSTLHQKKGSTFFKYFKIPFNVRIALYPHHLNKIKNNSSLPSFFSSFLFKREGEKMGFNPTNSLDVLLPKTKAKEYQKSQKPKIRKNWLEFIFFKLYCEHDSQPRLLKGPEAIALYFFNRYTALPSHPLWRDLHLPLSSRLISPPHFEIGTRSRNSTFPLLFKEEGKTNSSFNPISIKIKQGWLYFPFSLKNKVPNFGQLQSVSPPSLTFSPPYFRFSPPLLRFSPILKKGGGNGSMGRKNVRAGGGNGYGASKLFQFRENGESTHQEKFFTCTERQQEVNTPWFAALSSIPLTPCAAIRALPLALPKVDSSSPYVGRKNTFDLVSSVSSSFFGSTLTKRGEERKKIDDSPYVIETMTKPQKSFKGKEEKTKKKKERQVLQKNVGLKVSKLKNNGALFIKSCTFLTTAKLDKNFISSGQFFFPDIMFDNNNIYVEWFLLNSLLVLEESLFLQNIFDLPLNNLEEQYTKIERFEILKNSNIRGFIKNLIKNPEISFPPLNCSNVKEGMRIQKGWVKNPKCRFRPSDLEKNNEVPNLAPTRPSTLDSNSTQNQDLAQDPYQDHKSNKEPNSGQNHKADEEQNSDRDPKLNQDLDSFQETKSKASDLLEGKETVDSVQSTCESSNHEARSVSRLSPLPVFSKLEQFRSPLLRFSPPLLSMGGKTGMGEKRKIGGKTGRGEKRGIGGKMGRGEKRGIGGKTGLGKNGKHSFLRRLRFPISILKNKTYPVEPFKGILIQKAFELTTRTSNIDYKNELSELYKSSSDSIMTDSRKFLKSGLLVNPSGPCLLTQIHKKKENSRAFAFLFEENKVSNNREDQKGKTGERSSDFCFFSRKIYLWQSIKNPNLNKLIETKPQMRLFAELRKNKAYNSLLVKNLTKGSLLNKQSKNLQPQNTLGLIPFLDLKVKNTKLSLPKLAFVLSNFKKDRKAFSTLGNYNLKKHTLSSSSFSLKTRERKRVPSQEKKGKVFSLLPIGLLFSPAVFPSFLHSSKLEQFRGGKCKNARRFFNPLERVQNSSFEIMFKKPLPTSSLLIGYNLPYGSDFDFNIPNIHLNRKLQPPGLVKAISTSFLKPLQLCKNRKTTWLKTLVQTQGRKAPYLFSQPCFSFFLSKKLKVPYFVPHPFSPFFPTLKKGKKRENVRKGKNKKLEQFRSPILPFSPPSLKYGEEKRKKEGEKRKRRSVTRLSLLSPYNWNNHTKHSLPPVFPPISRSLQIVTISNYFKKNRENKRKEKERVSNGQETGNRYFGQKQSSKSVTNNLVKGLSNKKKLIFTLYSNGESLYDNKFVTSNPFIKSSYLSTFEGEFVKVMPSDYINEPGFSNFSGNNILESFSPTLLPLFSSAISPSPLIKQPSESLCPSPLKPFGFNNPNESALKEDRWGVDESKRKWYRKIEKGGRFLETFASWGKNKQIGTRPFQIQNNKSTSEVFSKPLIPFCPPPPLSVFSPIPVFPPLLRFSPPLLRFSPILKKGGKNGSMGGKTGMGGKRKRRGKTGEKGEKKGPDLELAQSPKRSETLKVRKEPYFSSIILTKPNLICFSFNDFAFPLDLPGSNFKNSRLLFPPSSFGGKGKKTKPRKKNRAFNPSNALYLPTFQAARDNLWKEMCRINKRNLNKIFIHPPANGLNGNPTSSPLVNKKKNEEPYVKVKKMVSKASKKKNAEAEKKRRRLFPFLFLGQRPPLLPSLTNLVNSKRTFVIGTISKKKGGNGVRENIEDIQAGKKSEKLSIVVSQKKKHLNIRKILKIKGLVTGFSNLGNSAEYEGSFDLFAFGLTLPFTSFTAEGQRKLFYFERVEKQLATKTFSVAKKTTHANGEAKRRPVFQNKLSLGEFLVYGDKIVSETLQSPLFFNYLNKTNNLVKRSFYCFSLLPVSPTLKFERYSHGNSTTKGWKESQKGSKFEQFQRSIGQRFELNSLSRNSFKALFSHRFLFLFNERKKNTKKEGRKKSEKVKQKMDFVALNKNLIRKSVGLPTAGQIIHISMNKITLRRAQPIFISPKSILHVSDGSFVFNNNPVMTLTYQRLKTGDIVQGIPKVEQYLEARITKQGRLFRDCLPNLLKGLFKRYRGQLPLDRAVRQSFYKIQQIIVDGVLRVYRSQGVTIADKHLEVIVKQMTSKVKIINGAQTGFFPGEIIDLQFVERVNLSLMKKIQYEPLILGITRAALEVDSFLSAASFQQTTRVLSSAAIEKRKDFLKGLKENILLGNLMPAGTGYLVYLEDLSF